MSMKKSFKNEAERKAYFDVVVIHMNANDAKKQSKIDKHELPIGDLIYDNFSKFSSIDEEFAEQSLLGWIELIENPNLYKAVKKLSVEEQIFISYIFKKDLSLKKAAKKYNLSLSNSFGRLNKIIRILKNNLLKK